MAHKKDMANLLEDIAKITNTNLDTVKEAHEASTLYSHEEQVYEAQAVIGYYQSRVAPKPIARKSGESNGDFAQRQAEYEAAYHAWRFKICKGCNQEFAYSWSYDGVSFCSLDCLDTGLAKVGLKVTRNRPLSQRWGSTVPAIVPSSALKVMNQMQMQQSDEAFDPTTS